LAFGNHTIQVLGDWVYNIDLCSISCRKTSNDLHHCGSFRALLGAAGALLVMFCRATTGIGGILNTSAKEEDQVEQQNDCASLLQGHRRSLTMSPF